MTAAAEEAQAIHDQRRREDPEHDQVSCWCCCTDCDFDYEQVAGQPEPAQPVRKEDEP